jgi:hypothetical protein
MFHQIRCLDVWKRNDELPEPVCDFEVSSHDAIMSEDQYAGTLMSEDESLSITQHNHRRLAGGRSQTLHLLAVPAGNRTSVLANAEMYPDMTD